MLSIIADSSSSSGGFVLVSIIWSLITIGMLAIIILTTVYWVLSLIHALQHEDVKDRTVWIVVLIAFGGISGIIYHFAVRKPYEREHLAAASTANK